MSDQNETVSESEETKEPEAADVTEVGAAKPDSDEAEEVVAKPEADATGTGVEAPVASQPKAKKKRLPRSQRRTRTKIKREKPAERKPITRLPKPEHVRGRRQERQGTVVSASADKTIVVRVDVVKVHPKYKKVIKRSTRLHAHDEQNRAKPGDVVRVVETKPLSRLKRWRLHEIVEAAK